jgi:hypothetical protein
MDSNGNGYVKLVDLGLAKQLLAGKYISKEPYYFGNYHIKLIFNVSK